MDERYPEQSESQAIARDAEKVFERLLSSRNWNDVKTPQERDYGIDYRVEAISEGKLKGCEFYVQLKGMRSTGGEHLIPVSLSTATLRYWSNKLLPILIVVVDCAKERAYFEWFDKSLEIAKNQKTQTIHVSKDNQFFDYKLLLSLEPLYGDWTSEVRDCQKRAVYEWLLLQSISMTNLLLHTVGRFAYDPTMNAADSKEKRLELLKVFLYAPILIMHRAKWVLQNVDLTKNPIDAQLKQMLSKASAVMEEMCFQAGEVEGWIINLTNMEAAYRRLPALAVIFTEIGDFLGHQLLSNETAESIGASDRNEPEGTGMPPPQ